MLTFTCAEGSATQSCDSSGVCTTTCTDPQWLVMPELLPPLSAGDGATIGLAIVLAWGAGVSIKLVIRFLRR